MSSVAWVVMAGSLASAGQRGLPASDGLLNFGKVNDVLYRGAQPDALGIAKLKEMGVKTILDLRLKHDAWTAEEHEATAKGISYTNVPLKGFGRPTPGQIAQVLAIIESCPSPVFVHCEHGCDRTGTVIACYRIRHDRWSSALALAEAKRFGLSQFEWGMKRFVREFGMEPGKK